MLTYTQVSLSLCNFSLKSAAEADEYFAYFFEGNEYNIKNYEPIENIFVTIQIFIFVKCDGVLLLNHWKFVATCKQ